MKMEYSSQRHITNNTRYHFSILESTGNTILIENKVFAYLDDIEVLFETHEKLTISNRCSLICFSCIRLMFLKMQFKNDNLSRTEPKTLHLRYISG